MAITNQKIQLLAEKNSNIRDLSDFCNKWPEFKSLVNECDIKETVIEPEVIKLILRLYQLADHVCPGARL